VSSTGSSTDDEFGQYVAEMGKAMDTILFGRVTYQMMAQYWPTSKEPEAPMMNDLPKIVFFEDAQEARLEELQAGERGRRGRDRQVEAAAG